MIVEIEIPPFLGPHETVRLARILLDATIAVNRAIMRRVRVPGLYATRVRYRDEPPGRERFDHVGIVLRRGDGDCDDLVAWRVAELHEAGEVRAAPRILWPKNVRRYHAQVRRADGSIEDPALILLRREQRERGHAA